MALKLKATVQAAIEAAIVNINDALEDTVSIGNIADPLKPSTHPLRDINQLMRINTTTGQFVIDLDFFDAAYDRGIAYAGRKNQINIS